MPPSSPPERILVVRLSHLGDIAQAIPLIHALRDRWPTAEFGWAAQPEFAALIEPLATVLPFDRRGGLRAWLAFRAAARRFRADLVLDAQGNWKSALAAWIAARGSRPCRRVGFALEHWQEPLAARVTGPELAPPSPDPHLVQRVLGLAKYVTGAPPRGRLDPALTEDERHRGSRLLPAPGPGAPVLLQPGVVGDPRSWPAASFQQLAGELLECGVEVTVITGPGESAVGLELERALPAAHHVVGQRGLRALAAAHESAARRGGCLVSGDSGPAHVAASVGLPVVLIAGPEDPNRTGPWPTPAAATATSPPAHRIPGPPWQPRTVTTITVADVRDAVLDLLTPRRAL